MPKKEILTVLKLDGQKFDKSLSKSTKDILKFSAAGAAVSATLTAISKTAANFQDSMIKSARVAGTTAEGFSSLTVAAEQSGLQIEQFRDALSKFQEEGPQKQLKSLGIAVKDVNGEARDSTKIFKDFSEHIASIENPAERTAQAVKVFGGEGARMLNMLSLGAEGLEKMQQKAEDFGLVVSTKAGQAAEKFNDDINDVSQSIKGLTVTIGESIIAFSNQSKIMDDVESVIVSITRWWKDLDDETKEYIISVVSLVGAIGTLIGVVVALGMAANAVFTMLAANPVILAIAGIVVAVILLGNEIRKNFDKMGNIIDPLVDSFRDLSDQISSVKDDMIGALDGIIDFGSEADEAGDQVDIFGTIAKNVFSALSTSLIVIMAAVGNTIDAFKLWGNVAYNLGDIIVGVFTLDSDRIVKGWDNLQADFVKNVSSMVDRSVDAGKKIVEVWSKPVIFKANTKELDKLEGSLDSVIDKNKEVKTKTKGTGAGFEGEYKQAGDAVQKFIGLSQTVIGQLSDIANSISEGIARAAEETIIKIQVASAKAEKEYRKTKEILEGIQEDELKALEDGYDKQIGALKTAEDKKQDIIENSAILRQAARDKEFQKEKELLEKEFETYIENERAKFEAKKEILDESTIDNEQRKLVDQIMEADFDLWVEDEKGRHEETLTELAKTFGDKRTKDDKATKGKLEEQATNSADAIKDLETAKDAAILKTTNDFLDAMGEMSDKEETRASKARKDETRAAWNRDLQIYNQTRDTKIAETIATGAASTAQAISASMAAFASIPVVGVALGVAAGAVIAGIIAKATSMRVSSIKASKPRKPAELRMASGGVLSGPGHGQGGIQNIEAEGGEGYLDVNRTRKFLNAADNMTKEFNNKSGKVVNINFGERSIIVNDINAMVPEVVDKISRELAADVRKRIAV